MNLVEFIYTFVLVFGLTSFILYTKIKHDQVDKRTNGDVAEQVDAGDLKSPGHWPCGFKSLRPYCL